MKISSEQHGFSHILIVVVMVLVAVVGFASWKVLESKSDSTDSKQTSMQSDSGTKNKGRQNTESEKVTTGVVITTGDSKFGKMLFNNKGQAIYIWELEESTKAECYEGCAKAWPPVLTDGAPSATGSVNNELLGTTQRTDGSTQVTYNGHPLYYYAHEKAGEVKCHKVSTHGGLWWVIQPSGIRAD